MGAAGSHHERLYHHHQGCRLRLLVAALILSLSTAGAAELPHQLVVCADPNNLPFSNRALQGFENKIIDLVAKDLGAQVSYVWWAQHRGYVRSTLGEAKCDLWPGVATGVDRMATTRPYYRSTYVFVTRADAPLHNLTLDDLRLKSVSIGVQMIGNNAMNTPPAHAIASRGMIDNVRGYMVYGDYSRPNPPSTIVTAVAKNEIDVALVWGPVAGYFAHRSATPLRIDAVTPAADPRWPMVFDISMGVRRNDRALIEQLNAVLERENPAIKVILKAYHVPLEDQTSPDGRADLPGLRGSVVAARHACHGKRRG
jgi:mxaJ protein